MENPAIGNTNIFLNVQNNKDDSIQCVGMETFELRNCCKNVDNPEDVFAIFTVNIPRVCHGEKDEEIRKTKNCLDLTNLTHMRKSIGQVNRFLERIGYLRKYLKRWKNCEGAIMC